MKKQLTKKISELAFGFSSLKDYQREHLKLIVLAYIFLSCILISFIQSIRNSYISSVIYGIMACLMILYFIDTSIKYRKFKTMSEFYGKPKYIE